MMNICKLLFSKVRSSADLFEDIINYDDIKKLFGMALDSDEPVHILLSGPPASAKTVFMKCLMEFADVHSYRAKYRYCYQIDKEDEIDV